MVSFIVFMQAVRNKLIFLFLLLLFFAPSNSTHAQTAGGIRVIPASIEKAADPGEVITETLMVTNVSDREEQYYIFTRNIKGVDNGGTPVFAQTFDEKTGYEMTDWVQFDVESVIVEPGQEVEVPVTITVPENASPGSHFGGIFVSKEAPKLREIGAGVGYEVATIISIRINGNILDDARIRSFSTDKLFYGSKNVTFSIKVENQGNILIRPRGPLEITGMFGNRPEVIIVNDTQAGVFPGTIRDFELNWTDESIGFGRYEAVLALAYEGEKGNRTIDASLVFWVFPSKIILTFVIVLLGIILSGYFLTKFYVQRAIMRAAGGRRIVPNRYRRQVGISRFAFVFKALMVVVVLFLIVLLIFFA